MKNSFAARLGELRRRSGLSQKETADALSLSVYAKSVLKLYVPKPIEKPVVFMKLRLVEN